LSNSWERVFRGSPRSRCESCACDLLASECDFSFLVPNMGVFGLLNDSGDERSAVECAGASVGNPRVLLLRSVVLRLNGGV
jgi:hypothetical protein